MPALHAKTPPLFVANTRHSPAMTAFCASIRGVLTRLSSLGNFLSASDSISKSPVSLLLGLAVLAALSAALRLDTNDLEME